MRNRTWFEDRTRTRKRKGWIPFWIHCGSRSTALTLILLAALAAVAHWGFVQAQQSQSQPNALAEVDIDVEAASGTVTMEHDVVAGHYYIVRRGVDPSRFLVPVDMALPARGGILRDAFPNLPDRAFYRIEQVPVDEPQDTDGDGIDDVYELERPNILNPLLGADAKQDPDENGLSHLLEYLQSRGTLSTILSTSPADREDGIAVTRETIVRLSVPLDPIANVSAGAFTAEFAGQTLDTRMHISRDRRNLTLFYDNPLPASARVRLNVNGGLLLDELGRFVDADGDGTEGGQYAFSFDTLGLTVIPDLAVCGRVFASEPVDAGGNENWVNRPLGGATITVDGMEDLLRATTDEFGNFRLAPVPAGRFFVHVDGRTVTANVPEGAYYPFVGKTWTAGPGVAAAQDAPPITNGLQVWLSARAGTGDAADGEPVPTWTDQAHGHVFNAANAEAPTFVANAGGGFPAIDFARNTGYIGDFSSTAGATISDATIFVVGRFDGYVHEANSASFWYSIDSATGESEHTLGRDERGSSPDVLYRSTSKPRVAKRTLGLGSAIRQTLKGFHTTRRSVHNHRLRAWIPPGSASPIATIGRLKNSADSAIEPSAVRLACLIHGWPPPLFCATTTCLVS